jgi:ferredoxin
MADKTKIVPQNVPGKWYVDEDCTPCHTCMSVEGIGCLLKYNEDESKVYFHKQPSTPEEEQLAEEALSVCPTQCIGKDGE